MEGRWKQERWSEEQKESGDEGMRKEYKEEGVKHAWRKKERGGDGKKETGKEGNREGSKEAKRPWRREGRK